MSADNRKELGIFAAAFGLLGIYLLISWGISAGISALLFEDAGMTASVFPFVVVIGIVIITTALQIAGACRE